MSPALTLSIAGVITGVTWIFVEIASAVRDGSLDMPANEFSDCDCFGDPRAGEILFHEPLNNPEVRHDHG